MNVTIACTRSAYTRKDVQAELPRG